MRVLQIPIEPLEERYSSQWREWFEQYWEGATEFIDGVPLTSKIEVGSFLDVFGTCYYKSSQLLRIIEKIKKTDFGTRPDDWVFFHDLWNPIVIDLAYMRSGARLPFKIAGCLHAGTWDQHDFLVKHGMNKWCSGFENSIFQISDVVFTATNFHKNLIAKKYPYSQKIYSTGFPIYPEKYIQNQPKERLVVFPHRMNSEKNPHKFIQLGRDMMIKGTSFKFVFSKDVCQTKKEYYDLLSRAAVAVSFADQETWGIAMQESIFHGCIPLVPNRLSYPEMYDSIYRYNSYAELVVRLRTIENSLSAENNFLPLTRQRNCDSLIAAGKQAIPNMIKIMQSFKDSI
jgi:hypothetical protein